MKRSTQLVAITSLLATLVGSGLKIASASENDATQIAKSKIDLKQAINIAEKKYGGKAAHAEFEDEHGKPVFEIEIVSRNVVRDVKVDGHTGQVIKATIDKADAKDHEENDR